MTLSSIVNNINVLGFIQLFYSEILWAEFSLG